MNDPRSILQTAYTTVGCGGMAYFAVDNNGIPSQHPDGYDTAAEICVIEADNDGSVRIRGYDLNSDTYLCDYYIEDVNNRETYAYNYKNMKAHDTAPVFGADTKATAFRNEDGQWIISFDEAEVPDGYIVHDYTITIKDSNGLIRYYNSFVNDYFVIDGDSTADFRIGANTLESGKEYTLRVRASTAYNKHSDIELNFTAQ